MRFSLRRSTVLVAGAIATVTLALPTAAFAETQVFVGEGGSAASANAAAVGALEFAGYSKSQCTFRTRSVGFQDIEVTATCSR